VPSAKAGECARRGGVEEMRVCRDGVEVETGWGRSALRCAMGRSREIGSGQPALLWRSQGTVLDCQRAPWCKEAVVTGSKEGCGLRKVSWEDAPSSWC
jgi:hypothetical protein